MKILSNWSLGSKLILAFLGLGLSPMLLSNIVSYIQSQKELTAQASDRVRILGEAKSKAILDYFQSEADQLTELAHLPEVSQALKDFSVPFRSAEADSKEPTWAAKYRDDVTKFYAEAIAPLYKEKTGTALNVEGVIQRLDWLSLAAQFGYIVDNENPLGKKDNLVSSKRPSWFNDVHGKFHPFFRRYQQRHSLYDLFLVNKAGRVVYSVFKETDFATSLSQGPWSETGLAKAFQKGLKLGDGEVHFEDFEPYTPSYEAPASFAATPIYVDGKVEGVLMVQLPLDKISQVAGERAGFGEQGETLFLGSDGKLRADTFRNAKTHTVGTMFAKGSKLKLESNPISAAFEGKTGVMEDLSYDGTKVLSYFRPLKVQNMNWVILTELDSREVFSGLHKMNIYLGVLLGICGLVIGVFSYIFGRSIANSLREVTQALTVTSGELGAASKNSAETAGALSDSATEQAASIQETMASAEEISAMVNQNADSSVKALDAVGQNQKSCEEGVRSVEDMLNAIREIRDANSQILAQMDASNKELVEIVKIITSIGEKTNVINEIVFQTKLLSFNASVEAARAGEHGKGFAVVAEEVGNLAQMSGNAAKEITDLLSASIRQVNGIVETTKTRVDSLVEVGKDKVATGQATAERCRSALQKIRDNAVSISQMISEIASASKEQAQGVSEINKAIAQMDQTTQKNSLSARESSGRAESLKLQAGNLSNAIQDLAVIVEGQVMSHSQAGVQPNRTPTRDRSEANVIPIKTQPSSPPHEEKKSFAKVVGSESVPDANHSGFEDL